MKIMTNIASYSPRKARKLWIGINTICLAWSLLLFIDIFCTLRPLERLHGTQDYLVWSFGTTIVWVLEVGLNYFEMQQSNFSRNLFDFLYFQTAKDVGVFVEFLAAIYFLVVSAKVFIVWHKADTDVGGQTLDTTISSLAYAYQLFMLLQYPAGSDDYVEIDEEEKEDINTRLDSDRFTDEELSTRGNVA
mmetsp:Transcript_75993/g.152672  ORF Transcript_75993/g.152672 Transcript_75993/m.152672 type:complete len:190 (+) Transcript_75993:171-740(+)